MFYKEQRLLYEQKGGEAQQPAAEIIVSQAGPDIDATRSILHRATGDDLSKLAHKVKLRENLEEAKAFREAYEYKREEFKDLPGARQRLVGVEWKFHTLSITDDEAAQIKETEGFGIAAGIALNDDWSIDITVNIKDFDYQLREFLNTYPSALNNSNCFVIEMNDHPGERHLVWYQDGEYRFRGKNGEDARVFNLYKKYKIIPDGEATISQDLHAEVTSFGPDQFEIGGGAEKINVTAEEFREKYYAASNGWVVDEIIVEDRYKNHVAHTPESEYLRKYVWAYGENGYTHDFGPRSYFRDPEKTFIVGSDEQRNQITEHERLYFENQRSVILRSIEDGQKAGDIALDYQLQPGYSLVITRKHKATPEEAAALDAKLRKR